MSMSDPIADMLTRIRNASRELHPEVSVPYSGLKTGVLRILKEEGYIEDYRVESAGVEKALVVRLKYTGGRRPQPVFGGLRRVSSPGLRRYTDKKHIPRVLGGIGTTILSTSQGLLTGREARRRGIGGEVVCQVW